MITPGGEIQKRRAFVKVADLPGTFGLAATESRLLVFGRNVDPAVPALGISGIALDGIKIPNAATDMVQTDYDIFDGRIYVAMSVPSGGTAKAKNPHYFENTATVMSETEGSGKGQYVRTFQSKIYSVEGKYLYFTAINNPMLWTLPTPAPADPKPWDGSGYINLSLQDADSERLTSLEVYYNKLAIFSSKAVQIWAVDADPLQNAFEQLLRAAGTNAPQSPLQYGNGDVQYLDQSGIRSLKAKDSSNSASVSDIGSPIDPIIRDLLADKGSDWMNRAVSLLEPSIGRFWMVFPDRILTLSYFPGPNITAWSQTNLNFQVQYAVTCGGRIFIRDINNGLWVYGGVDGRAYDNCGVVVRLPYLDGKKPGHKKLFQGFDATVSGTWTVAVSYDFTNPETEDTIGVVSQPTWNAGRFEQQGYDSHFSLRFYNNDALPATISNCAIHYEMADAEA